MGLTNVFQMFPGIGVQMEKKLREIGFQTWEDILSKPYPTKKVTKAFQSLKQTIPQIQLALKSQNTKKLSCLLSCN